jgi:alkylhydroperoxidase family enzyme
VSDQSAPPRIAPVSVEQLMVDPGLARDAFGGTSVFQGNNPLLIHRTMAHHRLFPDLAVVLAGVTNGELAARDREYAVLRVAWHSQCDYIWAWHCFIATQHVGMSTDEIAAIASWRDGGWSPKEKALLSAVDQLYPAAGTTLGISGVTWKHLLAEHYKAAQILELPILVGLYVMSAGIANSVGLELDPQLRDPQPVPAWYPPGVAVS